MGRTSIAMISLLLAAGPLSATRGPNNTMQKQWEFRHEIAQLEHMVETLETELTQTRQQIENQQLAIDALYSEHRKAQQYAQEALRQQEDRLESKIASSDRHPSEDTKSLRKYVQEANQTFTKVQEKLRGLEDRLQNQESAIRNVVALLQSPDASFAIDETSHHYEVKAGDTLGELAKQFGTSVKTLQELNGLSSDRIHAGKKLKLPKG